MEKKAECMGNEAAREGEQVVERYLITAEEVGRIAEIAAREASKVYREEQKKSEKKVKLAERASSHTCKMCKRGRIDARRQACPPAEYRMGSVYLFHAKRVTIHTLPRASELCAGDAKPRTRYNLP